MTGPAEPLPVDERVVALLAALLERDDVVDLSGQADTTPREAADAAGLGPQDSRSDAVQRARGASFATNRPLDLISATGDLRMVRLD